MVKIEVIVTDDSCDVCLLTNSIATTFEKEVAFNIKRCIMFWLESIVGSAKEMESENGKN